VRGLKVCAVVVELVVLDDDQTCNGCQDRDIVERGVRVCALLLLLRGMGWLENENALDEEEDGG